MERQRSIVAVAACALLLLGVVPVWAQPQLIVASGPVGGVWYPVASGMVEILQNKAAMTLTQQPGGGISNVFNVGAGKAHLGFTTADVAGSAILGEEDFKGKAVKNLRLLGVLYPQQLNLAVLADSPIRKVLDLKGRALVTTQRGTSTELMTRRVLEAHGLTYSDLRRVNHAGMSDGVNLMKDGHVEAMSHLITNPAAYLLDLASSKPIRLLSLDPVAVERLLKFPGYTRTTIKAGIYRGQDQEALTINSPVMLVTREELEESVVYKITRALFENRSQLVAVHKVMEHFRPEEAAKDPVIPIHPGALRYYKEAGVAR
ncbi:MAG: TAXI family TRAP transporter solute-binding subunit [Candidatus Rokubacteria bacterium]|nr:TAXI family TRAP transporter solute-binding subunit [Candidatus Rokubacteria bacterium]